MSMGHMILAMTVFNCLGAIHAATSSKPQIVLNRDAGYRLIALFSAAWNAALGAWAWNAPIWSAP